MSWVLDEEVLAVLAAITIVASVFAMVQAFNVGRIVEPFSELGLLGPEGKIADYPREVVAGSPFPLNVYIGSHEGKTSYYKVLVKVGDESSTINETTPLVAKPIMELRVVLRHNSSQVIPVNITLYEQKNDARLIFELWIFNEASGAFSYHGRWNQIWLNVTKPELAEVPQPQLKAISPEMESKLAEGFLSLRRAEDSGGEITEMVNILNRAILSAESGGEMEAEELIDQLLAVEPEVLRMGLEAGRLRLYTVVSVLATGLLTGVGSFLYLRRRIWTFWAKFHGDWKVEWSVGSFKLGNFDKRIVDLIKSGDGMSLSSLVLSSTKAGYREHEVARAIYRLARMRAVKIADPNPPKGFAGYMLSRYNSGHAVAVLLLALCIISVYTSSLYSAMAALRIVLGILFVLFLPGYSLIEALYPREDELSPLERLALSIGMSLALVPLVGLFLNYTPWGIRLDPIIVALSMLTLALLLVSAYRKFSLLKLRVLAASG